MCAHVSQIILQTLPVAFLASLMGLCCLVHTTVGWHSEQQPQGKIYIRLVAYYHLSYYAGYIILKLSVLSTYTSKPLYEMYAQQYLHDLSISR